MEDSFISHLHRKQGKDTIDAFYLYTFIAFDQPLSQEDLEEKYHEKMCKALEFAGYEERYTGADNPYREVGGRLTRWHALVYERHAWDL